MMRMIKVMALLTVFSSSASAWEPNDLTSVSGVAKLNDQGIVEIGGLNVWLDSVSIPVRAKSCFLRDEYRGLRLPEVQVKREFIMEKVRELIDGKQLTCLIVPLFGDTPKQSYKMPPPATDKRRVGECYPAYKGNVDCKWHLGKFDCSAPGGMDSINVRILSEGRAPEMPGWWRGGWMFNRDKKIIAKKKANKERRGIEGYSRPACIPGAATPAERGLTLPIIWLDDALVRKNMKEAAELERKKKLGKAKGQ